MSTNGSQAKRRQRQPGRRGAIRLVRGLILAATLVTVGRQPTAQAAVFNIPCGNVVELITAITTANANGQDDTITLAACTYT